MVNEDLNALDFAAPLPNSRTSRAVLIGCSTFTYFDELPSVRNNLEDLGKCLLDKSIWGIQAQNLSRVYDPTDQGEILGPIDSAAAEAEDTLLIYYAGHGMMDRNGNLRLAMQGSKPDKPWTATSYEEIRGTMQDCMAKRRVVILDCCFSGHALGAMAGGEDPAKMVVDNATAEGTFLLAAAAENSYAIAPPGKKYTAFTGQLIDLLEKGYPDAPEFMNLNFLYRTLRLELRARGFPEPQKRDRNTAGELILARNRAIKNNTTPNDQGQNSISDTTAVPLDEPESDDGDAIKQVAENFRQQKQIKNLKTQRVDEIHRKWQRRKYRLLTIDDVYSVAFHKPQIGSRGYNEDEVDGMLFYIAERLSNNSTVTADDVHNVAFSKPPFGERGYLESEVDTFLDLAEETIRTLDYSKWVKRPGDQ